MCSLWQPISEYASKLITLNAFKSKPLDGLCIGLITETVGDGVDPDVSSAIMSAASHLEGLGAKITKVMYMFTNDMSPYPRNKYVVN